LRQVLEPEFLTVPIEVVGEVEAADRGAFADILIERGTALLEWGSGILHPVQKEPTWSHLSAGRTFRCPDPRDEASE
jgi:hypothetical protein